MYVGQILSQFGDSKWLRPIYNNRPNFHEIVTASNWIVQTLWINFSYTYWDEIITGRSTRFIWWTGCFGVRTWPSGLLDRDPAIFNNPFTQNIKTSWRQMIVKDLILWLILSQKTIPTVQLVLKSNNYGTIKIPSRKRRSDY